MCRTLIVREGEPLEIESLSELGIFGLFLRKGDELLLNEEAGHLVRTKVILLLCAWQLLHHHQCDLA